MARGHNDFLGVPAGLNRAENLRIDGSAKKAESIDSAKKAESDSAFLAESVHGLGKNFAEFQNSAKGARCTQTGHF